jgi:hypothetical protein
VGTRDEGKTGFKKHLILLKFIVKLRWSSLNNKLQEEIFIFGLLTLEVERDIENRLAFGLCPSSWIKRKI